MVTQLKHMNILKYLTNRKYRFFYKKINDVAAAIWEMEFKINKSRQVREGVREDRDRAVENVNSLTAQIPNANEEIKKRMETDLAVHSDNVKRYEAQMKMIDDQIAGVPASGENPGQQGLMETVASYVELRNMYKSYLKTI